MDHRRLLDDAPLVFCEDVGIATFDFGPSCTTTPSIQPAKGRPRERRRQGGSVSIRKLDFAEHTVDERPLLLQYRLVNMVQMPTLPAQHHLQFTLQCALLTTIRNKEQTSIHKNTASPDSLLTARSKIKTGSTSTIGAKTTNSFPSIQHG